MNAGYLAGSLALACAAPQVAQAQGYPLQPVFAAFAEACGPVDGFAGTSVSVTKAGWRAIDDVALPDLANFLNFARTAGQAMAESGGLTLGGLQAFQRDVAGEQLAIVVSEVTLEGARVTGCRLFDTGETRVIPFEDIAALVGTAADEQLDRKGLTVVQWGGGLAESHDSFDFYRVAPDSEFVPLLHFSGLAMKVDSKADTSMTEEDPAT